MQIALVYKSGGDFDVRYVEAICNALRNYGRYNGLIYCLTDRWHEVDKLNDPIPIELTNNFPGWWSKIELFYSELFVGRTIYFDLDTLILDDISLLINACRRIAFPLFLRGNHPTAKQNNWLASGIMSWSGDELSFIYNEFCKDPKGIMDKQKSMPYGAGQQGDQGFIREMINKHQNFEFFQDYLPKNYILFKRQVLQDKQTLEGCHIFNWSGKKRLHFKKNPYNEVWEKCLNDSKNLITS